MGGRDPLEENFGFWRVNISVDPSGPCGHPFVVSNETVHVFVQFIPLLHVVPSAKLNYAINEITLPELELQPIGVDSIGQDSCISLGGPSLVWPKKVERDY